MNEPASASSRREQNSVEERPASGEGKSRGQRKLRLALAACGLLLAVFAGFLLAPDGGRDDLVKISFQYYQTNAEDHVIAWFSVTNAGKKGIAWMILESETRLNGQWTMYGQTIKQYPAFSSGGSGNIFARVPHDGQAWRCKVEWLDELTRFQAWRFKLKQKVGSMVPGGMPNSYYPLSAWRHTNYSDEFPR